MVPFTEEELFACVGGTHILCATVPLSLLEINTLMDTKFIHGASYDLYDDPVLTERGSVGWHLVRLSPVLSSHGRDLPNQFAVLGKDEEIPSLHTFVSAVVGHYLLTGAMVFANRNVRCRNGHYAGYFKGDSISIGGVNDGIKSADLGLAAELKV